MPNLSWYGSPNFTPGRAAPIQWVVVHWMDGWLAGADATFQNTERQTSAHYGVEDDTIHQYVDEANTAWHAGNWAANAGSVGIEHSAMPGRPATDATYASTIWLIAGICRRYGLDPATAIVPHQKFTPTSCPGTMDLPRIIAGVQTALGGTASLSTTITPIEEGFLMALSDQDQNELLTHARQVDTKADVIVQRTNDLAEIVDNVRKIVWQNVATQQGLATIDAKTIAATIPAGLAAQVADELAKRLAS